MDERRTSYRVSANGSMEAELGTDDGTFRGRVVDTSDGGVRVAFPRAEAPSLPVGAGFMDVVLTGPLLEGPVKLACTVRARAELDDVVEYGLGFRDARQVGRVLPTSARQAFNRRREPRIAAPLQGAWVEVRAADGPRRGERVMGALVDVSASGLGMLLDASSEAILADSPLVTCIFEAPGRSGPQTRAARIVHRTLQDDRVRYGVAFLEPDRKAPVAQAYEAVWDCVVCGTRLLLAQSHVHCPGCGTARSGERTYFPEWEEAELNTEHWAWGDERSCPFCDLSYSYLSTFCGRCGRPLP